MKPEHRCIVNDCPWPAQYHVTRQGNLIRVCIDHLSPEEKRAFDFAGLLEKEAKS